MRFDYYFDKYQEFCKGKDRSARKMTGLYLASFVFFCIFSGLLIIALAIICFFSINWMLYLMFGLCVLWIISFVVCSNLQEKYRKRTAYIEQKTYIVFCEKLKRDFFDDQFGVTKLEHYIQILESAKEEYLHFKKTLDEPVENAKKIIGSPAIAILISLIGTAKNVSDVGQNAGFSDIKNWYVVVSALAIMWIVYVGISAVVAIISREMQSHILTRYLDFIEDIEEIIAIEKGYYKKSNNSSAEVTEQVVVS